MFHIIDTTTSSRNGIVDSVLAYGYPYDISKTKSILEKVLNIKLKGAADIKRIGPASLDICRVATGQYDAYFEFDLQPWDVAAAIIILNEAGGRLRKMDGQPFKFQKSSIVATNSSKELMKELIKVLKTNVDL